MTPEAYTRKRVQQTQDLFFHFLASLALTTAIQLSGYMTVDSGQFDQTTQGFQIKHERVHVEQIKK